MKKEIKKDTNRIAKVNSLIEHVLGPVLHEFLADFRALVTISKVETSKDMKWAKVWISIFPTPAPAGSPAPQEKTLSEIPNNKKIKPPLTLDDKILAHLERNIYDIQGELNKGFATKIIPRISFKLDTAPRYVEHIEELVRAIHEDPKTK